MQVRMLEATHLLAGAVKNQKSCDWSQHIWELS